MLSPTSDTVTRSHPTWGCIGKRPKTETGRPTSVGERLETEPREPLSGKLGGKGGYKWPAEGPDYKKGGKVKCMSKGGSTVSKRADGIATKGKTRGRII